VNPVDGESIKPGRIYVAPPDYHMIVDDGVMRLTRGPRENNFRPAVDPLFRSAAAARGSRVVGVILSGGLDDGTYGLIRIKEMGGVAVVQDPNEALVAGMPESAIRNIEVDHVLPVAEMAPLLSRLTHEQCLVSHRRGRAKSGSRGQQRSERKGRENRPTRRAVDRGPGSLKFLGFCTFPHCHLPIFPPFLLSRCPALRSRSRI
jgi:hypothetical protein